MRANGGPWPLPAGGEGSPVMDDPFDIFGVIDKEARRQAQVAGLPPAAGKVLSQMAKMMDFKTKQITWTQGGAGLNARHAPADRGQGRPAPA